MYNPLRNEIINAGVDFFCCCTLLNADKITLLTLISALRPERATFTEASGYADIILSSIVSFINSNVHKSSLVRNPLTWIPPWKSLSSSYAFL